MSVGLVNLAPDWGLEGHEETVETNGFRRKTMRLRSVVSLQTGTKPERFSAHLMSALCFLFVVAQSSKGEAEVWL